jgi:hypothetical protein
VAVSRRLRYEVLRRDDFTCRYCGGKAPDVELEVDHVQPTTLGGSDEPSNLATACAGCNAGKSSISPDSPIVEGVSDDALRWARAMEMAAEIASREAGRMEGFCAAFVSEWEDWKTPDGATTPLPAGWERSIGMWIRAGLSQRDIHLGIPIVMEKRMNDTKRWRYFCGVMWRKLEARQDAARHLIDTDQA